MSNKSLVLIRGLPGSGKSTLADCLYDELDEGFLIPCCFVEADMYFIRPDGVYDFNYKVLPNAHKWALDEASVFMDDYYEWPKVVIVANTFTKEDYLRKYVDQVCGNLDSPVNVYVIECKGDHGSIHDVPSDVVEGMKNKWEVLDDDKWNIFTFDIDKNSEPDKYRKMIESYAEEIVGNMS